MLCVVSEGEDGFAHLLTCKGYIAVLSLGYKGYAAACRGNVYLHLHLLAVGIRGIHASGHPALGRGDDVLHARVCGEFVVRCSVSGEAYGGGGVSAGGINVSALHHDLNAIRPLGVDIAGGGGDFLAVPGGSSLCVFPLQTHLTRGGDESAIYISYIYQV